jgi:hypothetical protein
LERLTATSTIGNVIRTERGRLSSCYSVTERVDDETKAPKKTVNRKTKTVVGFIGRGRKDPSIRSS